jgi:hypothetical protein
MQEARRLGIPKEAYIHILEKAREETRFAGTQANFDEALGRYAEAYKLAHQIK